MSGGDGAHNNKSLIKTGTKLIEWIQQNRPKTSDSSRNILQSVNATNLAYALLLAGPEKLPFYGRYCGSFVEQQVIFLSIFL